MYRHLGRGRRCPGGLADLRAESDDRAVQRRRAMDLSPQRGAARSPSSSIPTAGSRRTCSTSWTAWSKRSTRPAASRLSSTTTRARTRAASTAVGHRTPPEARSTPDPPQPNPIRAAERPPDRMGVRRDGLCRPWGGAHVTADILAQLPPVVAASDRAAGPGRRRGDQPLRPAGAADRTAPSGRHTRNVDLRRQWQRHQLARPRRLVTNRFPIRLPRSAVRRAKRHRRNHAGPVPSILEEITRTSSNAAGAEHRVRLPTSGIRNTEIWLDETLHQRFEYDAADNLTRRLAWGWPACSSGHEFGPPQSSSTVARLADGDDHDFPPTTTPVVSFAPPASGGRSPSFAFEDHVQSRETAANGRGIEHKFDDGALAMTTYLRRFRVRYNATGRVRPQRPARRRPYRSDNIGFAIGFGGRSSQAPLERRGSELAIFDHGWTLLGEARLARRQIARDFRRSALRLLTRRRPARGNTTRNRARALYEYDAAHQAQRPRPNTEGAPPFGTCSARRATCCGKPDPRRHAEIGSRRIN